MAFFIGAEVHIVLLALSIPINQFVLDRKRRNLKKNRKKRKRSNPCGSNSSQPFNCTREFPTFEFWNELFECSIFMQMKANSQCSEHSCGFCHNTQWFATRLAEVLANESK